MPTAAAQASLSTTLGASPLAARAPREGNILLRSDLARLRRGWMRNRRFWVWLALAVANFAFCFHHDLLFGGDIVVSGLEGGLGAGLYLYFTCFHLVLFFTIPFDALRKTRAARGEVDNLLATPVPHFDIFWALWARASAPGLALILAFYLPLLFPFRWLMEPLAANDPSNGAGGWIDGKSFAILREAAFDAAAIALFALPWIKPRLLRAGVIVAAAVLLALMPLLGLTDLIGNSAGWLAKGLFGGSDSVTIMQGEVQIEHSLGPAFGCYLSNARWHPLVTLPYFLITAAWSAGAAVWLGLKRRMALGRGLFWLLLLAPGAEIAAMLLAFGLVNPLEFFADWSFLWFMLSFYMTGLGALWLGLKWNLLLALSRRRIPTE